MKLSKKELIGIAESLHSYNWFIGHRFLEQPYVDLLKERPHVSTLPKIQQSAILTQFVYLHLKKYKAY